MALARSSLGTRKKETGRRTPYWCSKKRDWEGSLQIPPSSQPRFPQGGCPTGDVVPPQEGYPPSRSGSISWPTHHPSQGTPPYGVKGGEYKPTPRFWRILCQSHPDAPSASTRSSSPLPLSRMRLEGCKAPTPWERGHTSHSRGVTPPPPTNQPGEQPSPLPPEGYAKSIRPAQVE